jgi:hypothetical protein
MLAGDIDDVWDSDQENMMDAESKKFCSSLEKDGYRGGFNGYDVVFENGRYVLTFIRHGSLYYLR